MRYDAASVTGSHTAVVCRGHISKAREFTSAVCASTSRILDVSVAAFAPLRLSPPEFAVIAPVGLTTTDGPLLNQSVTAGNCAGIWYVAPACMLSMRRAPRTVSEKVIGAPKAGL